MSETDFLAAADGAAWVTCEKNANPTMDKNTAGKLRMRIPSPILDPEWAER